MATINNECTSVTSSGCCKPCNESLNDNCKCTACSPLSADCSNPVCKPIMARRITDCIDFEETQTLINRRAVFYIDGDTSLFNDNDIVCISAINISYNCIGVYLPLSFNLGSNNYDFLTNISSCTCSYGIEDTDAYATFLAAYNNAIGDIAAINSGLTLADKRSLAFTAIQSTAEANNIAAQISFDIISDYASSNPSTFSTLVETLSSGALDNSNALRNIANLRGGTSANPAPITTAAQDAANASVTVANAIIALTDPPATAQALRYANFVGILNSTVASDIARATASPTSRNLLELISTTNAMTYDAVLALNDVINQRGLTELTPLMQSLLYIIQSNLSLQNAIGLSINTTLTITDINELIGSAITSLEAAKAALNFQSTNILLYNNLFREIPEIVCNNSINGISQLFYETFDNLMVCNLQINIEGTIGGNPFTASSIYDTSLQLSSLGFSPVSFVQNVCIPVNTRNLQLDQVTKADLALTCIIPQEPYAIEIPAQITADVIFCLTIDNKLRVINNDPISVFASNDFNCSTNQA